MRVNCMYPNTLQNYVIYDNCNNDYYLCHELLHKTVDTGTTKTTIVGVTVCIWHLSNSLT